MDITIHSTFLIGLRPGGGPQGMTSPVADWHVSDIEAKLAEVTTVTDPDGNVLGLLEDR